MAHTCNCGRQWTGLNHAHCTVCHAHFSTVANFDKHKPSYDGCLDPADLCDKLGRPVLKPSSNGFGVTWVGVGEHPMSATDVTLPSLPMAATTTEVMAP